MEERITQDYNRAKRSLDLKREQIWLGRRIEVDAVTGDEEVRVKARIKAELDEIDEQLENLKTLYYSDLKDVEGVRCATSLTELFALCGIDVKD